MQLARGLRWEIHAIKVWKEEGRQYSTCWGKEKISRCCKRKKRSSKRGMGLENPGEGAAGTLSFLGINVTVLLLDQGRHKEPMSSGGWCLFLHYLSLFFIILVFWLIMCKWRKGRACVVIKSDSDRSLCELTARRSGERTAVHTSHCTRCQSSLLQPQC